MFSVRLLGWWYGDLTKFVKERNFKNWKTISYDAINEIDNENKIKKNEWICKMLMHDVIL